ncbi:iron transporter [Candidatus Pantoea deserta]|uniref:Iron transporter n=1 Tax=Candidatus Pantoea deserta TaxID=1869313 RepID=A0A3N4NNI2_9GAMM|nr:FeoA domain-containing protein [Pantoea deserta]RPD97831.1 iron transporter [Pantoea deserta]
MLIKPGSQWRIEGYRDDVSPVFSRKLFSLGLVPGALIEIVRLAPLGDPAEVRIRRTSYALRKSELAMLRLKAVNGGEGV